MNPQPETLGQIFQNAAIQLQEAIRDGLKKRIAEDLDTRARIQKDLTTFRWECTDCPTVMYGFGTRSSAQLAAEKHEFSTLEFKRINR